MRSYLGDLPYFNFYIKNLISFGEVCLTGNTIGRGLLMNWLTAFKCSGSSIILVYGVNIFLYFVVLTIFVVFCMIPENLSHLIGLWDNVECGGVNSGDTFIVNWIGVWSELRSFKLLTECFMRVVMTERNLIYWDVYFGIEANKWVLLDLWLCTMSYGDNFLKHFVPLVYWYNIQPHLECMALKSPPAKNCWPRDCRN